MTTTTKEFHFKEGDNYTPETLHEIGEFIANHLGVDLYENNNAQKGVFKSDNNITIIIENVTNENGGDK